MTSADPLDLFLPPVKAWFRNTLGEPTAPQRQGWPSIAAGQHTLILAPTGSGKTLAAFLACLDHLWRQPDLGRGVRVLYVSPLKALNNDIHRNLKVPLEGVAAMARTLGFALPTLEAAVRTGDTPTTERQRLVRRPPHVLITTPESLNLMLTSRARDTLRNVRHVIVDEIHALCGNKRGVFLALLLERLESLQQHGSFVRIGLSATQRPLEEVARYLGGQQTVVSETAHRQQTVGTERWKGRSVTIVDAGLRKDVDLGVINPVEQFGPLPEQSVWPSIYRVLSDLIRSHRSTIVFTNDRRSAERITSFLNDDDDLARAHHGSVDLERRQEIEVALKEGRLPAVVATASLEMGIDMGAVDLVCQVASPGNVARALQRVGRAGHLVGQKSKGRFIPRMPADLLEQTVLLSEMRAGRVEELRIPSGCLDVLAQQLVAMVAMEEWSVPDLFALVRRAYPYRDLSAQAFETTLEMISGRYRFTGSEASRAGTMEALQPRISWDRLRNRVAALPGSQSLVLANGGTIPDTGQYAAYLANGTRIGELDEEFIYERRVGEAFLLGTNSWRLERIDSDRVIVSPAEGAPAIVPFWRGEGIGRSYDLGVAIGAFLREMAARLTQGDCTSWLREQYGLDAAAAHSLHHHVSRQLITTGALPTDRTLIIEASRDQLGDWQVLLLSPLGKRLHLALRFALESRLRARLGYAPQCLHHDDGILVRLTDAEEPMLDLLQGLTPANVEEMILNELADSALFALRFRQNAARSLLMPRGQSGRRAPLWLQRMRGRDLLQVARRHADFPVVVETFRECLHDHLDLPRLQELLRGIMAGEIEVITRRADTPSPFGSGLLFAFTAAFMYQYDSVEKDGPSSQPLDRDLLQQLLQPESQAHLLDPRAVYQVERRLRGMGLMPRNVAEMAEWLRRLGDLTDEECEGPMRGLLAELQADGRARVIELPTVSRPRRWILAEEEGLYQTAFGLDSSRPAEMESAATFLLERFLCTHALVGLEDILARYPFERAWAQRQLTQWVRTGRVVAVAGREPGEAPTYAAPENLEQVQRASLGLLRREVITCQPGQFCDFVLRWQYAHPETRVGGSEGLNRVLERLQGCPLGGEIWERSVLPARVLEYQSRWMNEWIAGGSGVWVAHGASEVAFLGRPLLGQLAAPTLAEGEVFAEEAEKVAARLHEQGASFVTDLASDTGLTPSAVRKALWQLARAGRVSNDQLDVLRKGEPDELTGEPSRTGPSLRSLRRMAMQKPEGRWSLLRWGKPGPEELGLVQCHLLLQWFGVVARELSQGVTGLLPWRILYEVLNRLELTGEVRRGYFVEGLSGAQFALPEAVELLQQSHAPATIAAPAVLLNSMDPANLYGSGAPFDIPLLDGGVRSLQRRPGNWVTLRAGKPVLLIEAQGKKITALASTSREDQAAAVLTLPGMLDPGVAGHLRRITVEEWNGKPVTAGEGRELLEQAGFVRDYQAMTLYGAYR
ncbi:MAG: DEAD/DEAH box helicase [Gemmataceae bacterium]